jgi:phosphatidylserine/phosphatidylglycerophosphate/cardiolipin synthase-like enzyme
VVTTATKLRLLILVVALLVGLAAFLALPRLPGDLSHLGMEPSVEPATIEVDARLVTRGAWYDLAFTAPRFPDRPTARRGGIDESVVELIDRSRRTLDVAVYEFNLLNIAEAMARAAERGVRVRVVTDTDTIEDTRESAVQRALDAVRTADITIVGDSRRSLMHHKFAVVDGEWVQTGSSNYTDREVYRNNNNAIVAQSRELAANYTAEFEKMFAARQFGPGKPAGVPHRVLSLAGTRVETYYSPQDRGAAHIIRWLGSARQSIHFMAFAFTHDGVGDTMLERSRAGVEVAGVFETSGSNTDFSEFKRLKEAGLDVVLDGNPYNMHHKVIIIDDRVSIFGSFNFSASADRENDENLLIAEDVGVAAAFEAEYQRVRATAASPPMRR